ncbi:hypothetical protein DW083_06065 [Parabacteroides sp. AF48-14]|uniref:hypothetical protein n=1 Tax=Parabacteroides sp. AF48-14 TaxID=2292052 RepID=UPI000EFF1A07|nr:hypothetical protein [Parabacteroides sp. AF48-14]RHO73409.1 hypothetical protein DW083_06065 [Parabacteroides sp. AF48-14]
MAARTVESFIKGELRNLTPQLRKLIETRKLTVYNRTYWEALEKLAEEYGGVRSIRFDLLDKKRRGNALFYPDIDWIDDYWAQPPVGEYTHEQAQIQVSKILLYRLRSLTLVEKQDGNTI